MSNFTYGVVTVSDSCHLKTATDESGPQINCMLHEQFESITVTNIIVPDEMTAIEGILKYFSDDLKLHCVLTTGGTGFAPRDVTPEATKNVINKECPQLALRMALESFKKTEFAALSRAVCGIRDKTLIINFPGSKKAVVECFGAIQSILPHAIQLIRDEKTKNVETHKRIHKNLNWSAEQIIQNVEQMVNKIRPKSSLPQEMSISSSFKSMTNSSVISESSDFTDFHSSSMEEIILDDDPIMVLPPRMKKSKSGKQMSSDTDSDIIRATPAPRPKHVCPHKTAVAGDQHDRNSPFPMISVDEALKKIFANIKKLSEPIDVRSPMDCPSFRASIKDGYAIKAGSTSMQRKVIGNISAGDKVVRIDFAVDECYKINTGAPLPEFADAIVQVEDTKLIEKNDDGTERLIELLQLPKAGLDIREIGSDVSNGELLFQTNGLMDVAEKTILASLGFSVFQTKPRIAVLSTGNELVSPAIGELEEGQIYDSNSTMLVLLLQKYGFEVTHQEIAKDDYQSLKEVVEEASRCDVIISSGGVSMGDKDFVKPLMTELGYKIHFGRVNMKPGKPMTFASNGQTSYFALPGNPVSAFVCFHLFVLPALRYMSGFPDAKCKLPIINVTLQVEKYLLDSRPEYARAKICYNLSDGLYYADMPENQMSSRLLSLIDADVLLHLPGGTKETSTANRGDKLIATVINHHFISAFKN